MKTIKYSELKTRTEEAPFYCVMKDDPIGFKDGRAFGCATLAFLNLTLLFKKKFGIEDGKTALDEARAIQEKVPENAEYKMSIEVAMNFLDQNPLFNRTRILCLNPSAMNPEIFLHIALRRLQSGEVVLAMLEVPEKAGDKATGNANHLSVFHSEDGEVFYDGLRMDLDTFLNMVLFSPTNTLFFFGKNSEVKS